MSEISKYRCETCDYYKTVNSAWKGIKTQSDGCPVGHFAWGTVNDHEFVELVISRIGCLAHSAITAKQPAQSEKYYLVNDTLITVIGEWDKSPHNITKILELLRKSPINPAIAARQQEPDDCFHAGVCMHCDHNHLEQCTRENCPDDYFSLAEHDAAIREDERMRMLDTLHTSLSARIVELKSWIKIAEINKQKKESVNCLEFWEKIKQ